jgi:hypothetical protein
MKHRAIRKPDGSIEVAGTSYRLDERGDRFVVVRAGDGGEIGAFRMQDAAHRFEIEASDEMRSVVRAIAKMLATPRGLLPLQ